MADAKKLITPEGAQALRDFAKAMPVAITNIQTATKKLNSEFERVRGGLGTKEHQEDFRSVLEYVEEAQKKAADAIDELPKKLESTAQKIDAVVAKRYRKK